MAGIQEKVHSYKEFEQLLPIIKEKGYNCIQIMGLIEHSYYGSFGYHVTNFYAMSSRYGSLNDLKSMIDCAHGLGIRVLVDLVHSHASKNVLDGLNMQDGTDYQYFHAGDKGNHSVWDSKCFDYGKYEVIRFLLANLAFLMDEYRVDGFRFDGITSMLYNHHGINYCFTGNYNEYFNENLDMNCVVYLIMANLLIHAINPDAITIAEDVSGLPTLAHKVHNGGIGFDYRLQMAVPDKWIKMLKEQKDEDWDVFELVHTLTNRRYDEDVIGYVESHDQALVGDKTIAQWLFHVQIYDNMSIYSEETSEVFRAMALHKIIRFITFSLVGDAYLNFMGNEFGHPEWIDFPRKENDWSYHYCRRRFDLSQDPSLRYYQLNEFDREMLKIDEKYNILGEKQNYITHKHNSDKIIIFDKNGLIFVFNLNANKSFENYRVGVRRKCKYYQMIFDTDKKQFGGHDRLKDSYNQQYLVYDEKWHEVDYHIVAYLPSRSAFILYPVY